MKSQSSLRLSAPCRPGVRVKPVAAACAALMLVSGVAEAQQAAEKTAQLDTVVVTGIRRSIEASIATKRFSDSIVEAISAEDIGKLPDSSIAEALARLPGLTGQRGSDGRVDRISIRGLSPEFSGVLLNGREIVSSNDSRAVEYDQFPAELVGSAVVYKTPDATLVGQGLSGTVDIRSLRPLSVRGRQMQFNVRGERNSNGNLVDGVTSPTGVRFSASYVDQFLDNKLGVSVGFARLDSPTQVKMTELVEYSDFTPFGLPLTGNAPSQVGSGQAMLPMFWTATSSTKKNVRDGLMATVEYKPSSDLHTMVDLYYSKFKTHEVGGKFAQSLFGNWSAGITPAMSNISTTQIGDNTYATQADISQLVTNVGNYDTRRTDDILAVGWNTALKLGGDWKAVADLSYSRDKRNERYAEAYGGRYDYANNRWLYGAFRWNVPTDNGRSTFTPLQAGFLADPANMAFGDVAGMDWVGNDAWIGAIRSPAVKDDIKSVRLSLERELEGMFNKLSFGFNVTQRGKDVLRNEDRILMERDGNGNFIRNIPGAIVQAPFDMSWAGIPQLLRVDVPALVASGAVTLEQGQFAQWAGNASNVNETVSTGFVKLDIDTELGGVALRGNLGLQAVHAEQESEGWAYLGRNQDFPDPTLLRKLSGGTCYTDYLPSLNLVADFGSNWVARFGAATSIVRPGINEMRAGRSTPNVLQDEAGTPRAGQWEPTYEGNPELKPWRATGFDLSVEKYFGKRSYVSVAAFRKNLLSYIQNGQFVIDTSIFPPPSPVPPGVTPEPTGPLIKPVNGTGGKVEGYEFAASLEGGLLHSALDGFGVVVSGSKLSSSIMEQLPNQLAKTIPLNGLSGRSNSVTLYYDAHGFQARVSQRYRSPFTATTRDIYFNSTTLQYAADKVIDVQLGYAFEQGPLKGLSVLLQAINLQDKETTNYKNVGANAPDGSQLMPNYTRYYGRQVLLGINYKL
jgi:iron complex outermembrane receptor protein